MHLQASPTGAGVDTPSADVHQLHQQTKDQVLRAIDKQLATHVVQLDSSGAASSQHTFKVVHNLAEELALGGLDSIGQTICFNAMQEVGSGHQSFRSGPLLYCLTDVSPSGDQQPAESLRVLLSATIHTVHLKPRESEPTSSIVRPMQIITEQKRFDGTVQIEMS